MKFNDVDDHSSFYSGQEEEEEEEDNDDVHLAPVLGTDDEDALSGCVFPCPPCSTNHLLILTPVEKLCTYVWVTQYNPAK